MSFSKARESLLALPFRFQVQISRKIIALEQEPLPASSRKLKGHVDLFRLRSGDYRVVYRADEAASRIIVTRIRHRKDAYRGL